MRLFLVFSAIVLLCVGCKEAKVDAALESDANGYACVSCMTKFYTARDVFATKCPRCGKPSVEQVLGFVCPQDQQVTINVRGQGFARCEKCGKSTSSVSIPSESALKTWGAAKKTGAEVGG